MATPLMLVLHNHQPVGNFPSVIEECYRTAYAPLLGVLEKHPGVRVGMHYTGTLWEWLQAEKPEYFTRVRKLVARGQVEVLGGGYYEPILPVIPERDRRGQLHMLRKAVTETFGKPPDGAWLAERVWEPMLPATLQAAGVRYVLIDDAVFHALGYSKQDTRATFITEDAGATVRVLPISYDLRYTIPTQPVDEVLATLRAMIAEGAEVLIYAEDGERFGNWEGMYDYLYTKEKYLDRLFTALELADDLECVLPGAYVAAVPPRSLVYLPPTSYTEMLEWSGGFWRNFLARYRESNLMHKKMLQVSRWCAAAEADGADVSDAQRDLYAAQCNCAYWYGVFGGIYLPHLRRAIYQHLLRAEAALLPLLPAGARPPVERVDHDADGHDEVFLRTDQLSVGIAPAQGGSVFALESLELAHNYLNTLARYPVRTEEDEQTQPVDWYPRVAFLDHVLGEDATPEAFADADCRELGDFVLGYYEITAIDDYAVSLLRDGHCWDGPEFIPLRVEKRYTVDGDGVRVDYRVTNTSAAQRTLRFAVELNVSLCGSNLPERMLRVTGADTREASLERTARYAAVDGMAFCDSWLRGEAAFAWSEPAEVWTMPVRAAMTTQEGAELVYQSTVVLPIWTLALAPGETWGVEVSGRLLVRASVP
jgi:alpha-amylase